MELNKAYYHFNANNGYDWMVAVILFKGFTKTSLLVQRWSLTAPEMQDGPKTQKQAWEDAAVRVIQECCCSPKRYFTHPRCWNIPSVQKLPLFFFVGLLKHIFQQEPPVACREENTTRTFYFISRKTARYTGNLCNICTCNTLDTKETRGLHCT